MCTVSRNCTIYTHRKWILLWLKSNLLILFWKIIIHKINIPSDIYYYLRNLFLSNSYTQSKMNLLLTAQKTQISFGYCVPKKWFQYWCLKISDEQIHIVIRLLLTKNSIMPHDFYPIYYRFRLKSKYIFLAVLGTGTFFSTVLALGSGSL